MSSQGDCGVDRPDRLYLLANGRIVMAGAPDVVLTPQWARDVYGVETLCFPHPATGRLLLAFEAMGGQ